MNARWQLPLQHSQEFPFKNAVLTKEALTAISYKPQPLINGKGQNQVVEAACIFCPCITSFICGSRVNVQASSYLWCEVGRGREDLGSRGDGAAVCLHTSPFFKRGGKEFQAWLKLQGAFL